MLANKLFSWLAAAVVVVGLAQSTHAGDHTPLFIEPGHFNHDLQFFAPAELDYFGDPPDPTTGWFFTYDRMYVGVTRPASGPRPWDLDMTWGNRFDIGYMTRDTGGWLFSCMHIDGPTGEAGSAKSSTSSVEFNKVFRLEPLFHNGVIEPFLGFRYVKFDDFGLPPIPADPDKIENNIVAGQLGVRAWKNYGHWKLSGEVRSFNGVNFQWFQTEDYAEFVTAGEVRAEAQYNLTRDVAIRFGYEFLYYGTGIARNNNLFENSEDLIQHGVTFGFTVNR